MSVEARQTWKNIQICQVEDAGTLWVREVPTDFMSHGLQEFQQMEKQMNIHFNKRPPTHSFLKFPANVGCNVVMHHGGYWYRGRVESIVDCDKEEEVEIFLVDYGIKVQGSGSSVVCLHPGEWMSVPYQARKIHLFGVLPVSLKYTFTALELKLILRESVEWDKSATDFVRKLFQLKPYAEFTPVLFNSDGCMHGLLTIHLTKEFWDVMPQFSPLHHLQPQEGSVSLDLAKVLVACHFATLDTNKLVEMLETWEKENTEKNSEKNDQQTDTPFCHLNQMALPSLKPFSQFKQMVRSKAFAEDFQGTTDRKELGLMSHSVSQGRGLLSANLIPHECFTPLLNYFLDNPEDPSTVFRSSGVSLASNSSHSQSDLSVKNLQTAELKFTNNDVLSMEEIPSLSYDSENLFSRLVQAPVITVGASNLEKSRKFSSETEYDGEKLDITDEKRAKEAFPAGQNDIFKLCLNTSTELTTTDNKFEVRKNVIHVPSQYENGEKISPKIPTQDLDKGEFAPILSRAHSMDMPNIVKMLRVFVAGESPIAEEMVIVNETMMHALLNSHIVKVLNNGGMRASQLQAYTWPVITRGSSAIVVGGKSCGKTLGYVIPLLSTILYTWQRINCRLVPGIGAVMVVVCKGWRNAKCVADYIVKFLPNDFTLKIMTAWGGCGHEETKNTKMQLLGGCDILITTAPCLLRLLMGKSVDKSKDPDEVNRDNPATSLTRCCHLIIDDVDSILENFSCEIKQLLTLWGEAKKKCGQRGLMQQIILVSSRWTKLFDSLTHMLIPHMDPTIIVSAPGEAAVAARIVNQFHLVLDENSSQEKLVELIQNFCSHKKNLVFVMNNLVAEKLKSMLDNVAIYSLSISDSTFKCNVQLIVQEWHMTKAVTLIVCKGAEHYLLMHDLDNADAIFHTYIPQKKSTFMLRYGFMVAKFSTNLRQESVNCESHLIISKQIIQSNPSVLNGLDRLFDIPEETFIDGSPISEDKPYLYSDVCYYLKAYGRCPVAPNCEFRHEILLSDIPNGLPRMGEVTFDVIKVFDASRYLVRLTEYREKAGEPSIDLRKNYLALFLALQQYFADPAKREPIKCAEQGMLCVVKDEDIWARAQVVRVNFSKDVPLIIVFLLDEGKELRVDLSDAFTLPPHFAAMPELIVEVYLCRIQPLDHDREWTLQASHYINDVFTSGNNRFVGRIVLALGLTLWLSPVTEFAQVGKTLIQKGSLRARLITLGFGTDNPSHLEKLELLCSKATISLDYQILRESQWKCVIRTGYELCNSQAEKNSCVMLKHDQAEDVHRNYINVEMQTCEKEDKLISNMTTDPNLDKDRSFSSKTQESSQFIQDTRSSSRSNVTPARLPCQDLTLAMEVRVEIGEIESLDRFFVIREDKLDRLDCLEMKLESLTQHSMLTIIKADTEDLHWGKGIGIPPSSHCIAMFTDDKYYRGLVKSLEPDGRKRVLFVDHGETLLLENHKIHAYPVGLLEELPTQAIPCTLAHIFIPANLKQEAARVMSQLADTTDIWTVKALEIQETGEEQVYSVELSDNSCDPPKEMWRELVCAGLAVHKDQQQMVETDERSLSKNPINVSHIEGKETAEFLFNIPSIKTHLEWLNAEQYPEEIHRKGTPLCKNMQLPFNHASNPDLYHILNPSLRDKSGNGSEIVVSGEDMKKENGRQGESSLIRLEEDIGSMEECDLVSDHLCDESPKKVVQEKKHIVKANKHSKNQRAPAIATNIFNEMCFTVPPLEAVEGITSKLFPETSWYQTEDSVMININLIGVEQYKCYLRSSHVTFMTLLGESFYVFDENLERDIDVESSFLRLRGTCVSLTLQKAVKEKWGSLLANREHRPLLRAECRALSSDDNQSSESEEDADWTRVVMDSPTKDYGGLPAGVSDSDISCDELSDGNDYIS